MLQRKTRCNNLAMMKNVSMFMYMYILSQGWKAIIIYFASTIFFSQVQAKLIAEYLNKSNIYRNIYIIHI